MSAKSKERPAWAVSREHDERRLSEGQLSRTDVFEQGEKTAQKKTSEKLTNSQRAALVHPLRSISSHGPNHRFGCSLKRGCEWPPNCGSVAEQFGLIAKLTIVKRPYGR